MQYTENLELKKPETTDTVNIADLNDNADDIDEAFATVQTEIDTLETSVENIAEAIGLEYTYDGTNIKDKDNENVSFNQLAVLNYYAAKYCRLFYTVDGVMRLYKMVCAKSNDYILFSSADESTIHYIKVAKSGSSTVITTSSIPNADNTSY